MQENWLAEHKDLIPELNRFIAKAFQSAQIYNYMYPNDIMWYFMAMSVLNQIRAYVPVKMYNQDDIVLWQMNESYIYIL